MNDRKRKQMPICIKEMTSHKKLGQARKKLGHTGIFIGCFDMLCLWSMQGNILKRGHNWIIAEPDPFLYWYLSAN